MTPEETRDLIAEIRGGHARQDRREGEPPMCLACSPVDWPCDAVRAADALEAATSERDAVPDAATEIERYRDAAEGNRIRLVHAQNDAEQFEAERDAALAAVERVRAAKLEVDSVHQIHGTECLCGFSSARSRSRTEHITEAILAALDGAPEPEWEYRATTDNGAFVGESRTTPEHAVQALQEAVDEYPFVLDEQGVKVERRPRSPWLPVEGSEL